MTQNEVTRSLVVPGPTERVWAALTDPAQLVRWMVPNLPEAQLRREPAGHLKLYMFGEMGMDFVTLDADESRRCATLRSLPDQLLTVTLALADEPGGTRVTATLGGLEALPAEARADRGAQTGAAWEQALANLGAFVTAAPWPYPQAFVGPLFGFWRTLGQQIAVERSVWIKAPRARVWRALTDPQEFQRWFSPTTPWVLTALEVGGRLFVVDPETKAELYTSVITALDPPARLEFHHPAGAEATEKHTTYTLAEEAGGTRLTLVYTGYENDPAEVRWFSLEQTTFGYGGMLANLKAAVEGTALAVPGGF